MSDKLLHWLLAVGGIALGTAIKSMIERLFNSACPRCSFRKYKQ